MGIGKLIGGGMVIAVVMLVLIALGIILGGLVGAGITALYNIVLGTSFAVKEGALLGSIVGMLGGASASSGGD